jgi:hypothetical protein
MPPPFTCLTASSFVLPGVDDFKSQFDRDFRFSVPGFGATAIATVVAGVIVAISPVTPGENYEESPELTITDPTGSGASATPIVASGGVTSFEDLVGGANYSNSPTLSFSGGGGDPTNRKFVRDTDVTRALTAMQASGLFNPALFSTQEQFTYAVNLLVAHFLCVNLLASSGGINGGAPWLVANKTVGDITEGFVIPDRISRSLTLMPLTKTSYGAQYLQLIAPSLVGGISAVRGQR